MGTSTYTSPEIQEAASLSLVYPKQLHRGSTLLAEHLRVFSLLGYFCLGPSLNESYRGPRFRARVEQEVSQGLEREAGVRIIMNTTWSDFRLANTSVTWNK